MPPMQARHVRTIAVLLKEEMIQIIVINQAMALVCPVCRRHSMVTRAVEIVHKDSISVG